MSVELEGCVESIIFRNEDNGYTVFELSTKKSNEILRCVGSFSFISEGEYYKLVCGEVQHNVYGKQYKVLSAVAVEPEDAEAMERYLGSGAIKGIGKVLAAKIVKKFGDDTFRVIEEEPERLSDIKGISERMARSISENFYDKREMRNAMMFLQKYGITVNMSVKLYKQYRSGIYQVLRTNPYRMAEEVKGIGFKTADEIAERGGIRIDPLFRIRAGMLSVLSEAVGQGHTYLPEEVFKEETVKLLGVDPEDLKIPLEELLLEKKIIAEDNPVKCYYPAPYYYMELAVARMLLDLDIRPKVDKKKLLTSIEKIQKELDIELDSVQKNAVEAAAGSGVMVLTGGPGTGKTTIIKAIIRYFEMEGMDILLAAPTGRAAKRMNEATGYEASTIHRMLQMRGGDEAEDDKNGGPRGGFERNEDNPLETDVIIIDEMSMVDISLMNALLKATSVGTRVIFVGDANQLPPVGAGNVLRDIISSKIFTTVCLSKIYRQAAMSDIVNNAHKINKGEEIALDNKSKDFFFIESNDINDASGVVIALVRDKLPKYVKTSPVDIQVISPTRKGELGVGKMNDLLQAYLNPEDQKKKEKVFGDIIFREGDKVMQIRNNYQLEWETRTEKGFLKASGSGIFNGDCGLIKNINNFSEELEIVFDDDKTVFYPFSLLEDLELAYCITVHKSQGSEYPAVVLPLLSGPKVLFNRNLLYTAVTRAQKCVTIVGSRKAVSDMIKNETELKRYSGLTEHLIQMKR